MPRTPYYRGPVSDHFDGTRFFNPGGEAPRGLRDVWRWQREGQRMRWPAKVAITPVVPPPTVADLSVTMVGHATMLIQTAGLNLLTDPVWSERASPSRLAGPRRVAEPGIRFEDLPKIDAVLLSHNHYDHLDLATLKRLKAHDPLIITPLGNDALLKGTGLRVETADWGESRQVGPLTLHLEPCHHWSARGIRDRSMALWAAFVIEGPAGKILHIGDTGFDQGRPYRDLPARHGALRLAILPIGAYEPRWFMSPQHQDPDEALQGFRLSGAAYGIGHHWGTFQLTDEGREAPPEALARALHTHAIPAERFRALAPADSWAIPPL
ncbi:MBL fold metallo-hydrolase [Pararhodobacter sp.]|uniref:MBL fold metallo-hydrolase n=1 Tax=Pararhodobacter sp. TaxID=2127056 RepID=UPI002B000DFD|nr:MBL fold metallo-hydrolase [Pararhodobacter sp.]